MTKKGEASSSVLPSLQSSIKLHSKRPSEGHQHPLTIPLQAAPGRALGMCSVWHCRFCPSSLWMKQKGGPCWWEELSEEEAQQVRDFGSTGEPQFLLL